MSQIDVYILWNVISQQRIETKMQFVLCSIPWTSLNPYMFKMPTFCHSTLLTVTSTERHTVWIVANEISLMACLKLEEYWISRHQSHDNIASMTSLRIVQTPAWLHQQSRYHWNFSSFRTDLSTQCTVPSTSELSRIFVIVALVGVGVPNSTLQPRTSTTLSTFQ